MRRRCVLILLALSLLFLTACGNPRSQLPQDETPSTRGTEATTPETTSLPGGTTEPTETSAGEPEDVPATKDSIARRFLRAMSDLTGEVKINVSGMVWEFGAENDLKNIYYGVLSEHPELKYTYDMEASVSGDTAVCKFLYMPYRTGAYDSGLPAGSHTVASLRDAKVMAQSMIGGAERLSIAITDPTLSVEDLQLALAQAGYGWIRFDLSRDGTEITADPAAGKTLEECASGINESFRLGSEILSDRVTPEMTDLEKATAIYNYIVENVSYDFRYYSDRENMPFESTVAMGALRDHLAICGGYAQAFEMLLDMCGIENYTVSGVSKGEYHMWNYVVLDGVGYYCDPTADRGGMNNHFMLTAEELDGLGGYSWDHGFLARISGTGA